MAQSSGASLYRSLRKSACAASCHWTQATEVTLKACTFLMKAQKEPVAPDGSGVRGSCRAGRRQRSSCTTCCSGVVGACCCQKMKFSEGIKPRHSLRQVRGRGQGSNTAKHSFDGAAKGGAIPKRNKEYRREQCYHLQSTVHEEKGQPAQPSTRQEGAVATLGGLHSSLTQSAAAQPAPRFFQPSQPPAPRRAPHSEAPDDSAATLARKKSSKAVAATRLLASEAGRCPVPASAM